MRLHTPNTQGQAIYSKSKIQNVLDCSSEQQSVFEVQKAAECSEILKVHQKDLIKFGYFTRGVSKWLERVSSLNDNLNNQ